MVKEGVGSYLCLVQMIECVKCSVCSSEIFLYCYLHVEVCSLTN